VLAFNISSPWRKGFYTNIPLIIASIGVFGYNTLLFFVEETRLEVFSMNHWVSVEVELVVFLWSFAVSLGLYINQKCIL